MKAQILKIAGVKNEKEFYKKFPTEEAFMKKHGKELEKAYDGTKQKFTTPQMTYQPIDMSLTGAMTKNPYMTGQASLDTPTGNVTTDSKFDSKAILNSIPGLAAAISDIGQTQTDINNLKAYSKISGLAAKAAATRPEKIQRKIDYNAMRSQTVNPLGVGTNYLQAEDGAEIVNTFAPNTIYTDMGYEPLNDSSQVKQFAFGGEMSPMLQGFAGNIGSAIGKGTGRGGSWSQIGSIAGDAASMIPGIGTAVGLGLKFGLPLIGGIVDANSQNEEQRALDKITGDINAGTLQSNVQSYLSGKSAFAEDGGWVSHDWQPQVITTFGEHKMSDLLKPPHDADMLRSGGHLAQVGYTAPSARAMYTGRMDDGGTLPSTNMMFDTDRYPRAEYGSQMAFGGDVRVEDGYLRPLSNDVKEIVGKSHKKGGTPFFNGENEIEAEGKETVMKTYGDGGPMDDGSVTIFGNRIINKDAADFVGIKPGRKYKIESKDLALKQDKFEKKATKNFASANDMQVDDMFSQIEQRTKLLNGQAFTTKAAEIKDQLQNLAIYQNETGDAAEALGLEINAFDKGIAKPVKESNMAKFGAKLESFDKGGKSKYEGDPNHFWIKRLLEFEKKKGASGGNPHDTWGWNNPRGFSYDSKSKLYKDAQGNLYNGDGKWTKPKTIEEAEEMFRKEYLPDFLKYPMGVRQRMADLAFNAGEDARIYELDQYLRKYKNMPEGLSDRPTYRKGKLNADNFENVYNQYKKEIEALPIEEQVGLLDKGRDFFYKNLNMQNGKPSSDYDDTWKYRISEIDFDTPEVVTTPATKSASSKPAPTPTPASVPTSAPTEYTAIPAPVKSSAPATKELWQIPKKERAALAIANGIKNYKGTKAQNMKLLEIINKPTPMMAPGTGVMANAPLPKFNMFAGINPVTNVSTPVTNITTPAGIVDDSGYIPSDEQIDSRQGLMPETYGNLDINPPADTIVENFGAKSDPRNQKTAGKNDWFNTGLSTLNSLVPFWKQTAQRPINPDQLIPEFMAMSMNQLEPVQAQFYNPMLQAQPYRVSFQDQRNEVTANARAAQKMAYGNPSAAAMIASQASDAINKINAEEFRANQAETMRAAEANRGLMNEAQRINLGIADKQYERQALASANTKQQNLEIAKSFAQKQAENRKVNNRQAILENMYPAFSYTKSGVAYKDPRYTAMFNIPDTGEGATSKEDITSPSNFFKNEEASKKKLSRNGSIVKAIKGL